MTLTFRSGHDSVQKASPTGDTLAQALRTEAAVPAAKKPASKRSGAAKAADQVRTTPSNRRERPSLPAHRPSRREDIVDAAIRLFARKGFVDAAIGDVADEADVVVTARRTTTSPARRSSSAPPCTRCST